jgi:hypothetical protein
VYDLGGGIIEFLAIGTAVKRIDGLTTESEQLIPQAIIRDQDTFINSADGMRGVSLNRPANTKSIMSIVFGLLIFFFVVVMQIVNIASHH